MSVAPAGKRNKDSLVTVTGIIRNNKAPSIAEAMSARVRLSDGREARFIEFPLPREKINLMPIHGQYAIVLPVSDYLPKKAILNPIPTGGAATGFMIGVVRDVTSEDLWQPTTLVILSFRDVTGRSYEISKRIATGSPLEVLDYRTLQHH